MVPLNLSVSDSIRPKHRYMPRVSSDSVVGQMALRQEHLTPYLAFSWWTNFLGPWLWALIIHSLLLFEAALCEQTSLFQRHLRSSSLLRSYSSHSQKETVASWVLCLFPRVSMAYVITHHDVRVQVRICRMPHVTKIVLFTSTCGWWW